MRQLQNKQCSKTGIEIVDIYDDVIEKLDQVIKLLVLYLGYTTKEIARTFKWPKYRNQDLQLL